MIRTPLVVAAAVLAIASPSFADVLAKHEKISGIDLQYKVFLPRDYSAAKEYPAILAFPGGGQTMPMVDNMIARNFGPEADKRGYIVVVAAAPAAGLFFEGGDRVFPAFLDKLLADYKVRGRKFHIARVSNGGLSAFHIATRYPQYFWSVTGFPGLIDEAPAQRMNALAKMCLYMYAGEMDEGWRDSMRDQAAAFKAKGMTVQFTVEKGEGHVMRTLEGAGAARLFDGFDKAANGCGK